MALEHIIQIEHISQKEVQRKDGQGSYVLNKIIADGIEYGHIGTIEDCNIGDYLRIIYQVNKGEKGTYYNILTLNKVIESEAKSMKQQMITTTKDEAQIFHVKGHLYWSHLQKPNTKGEYPSNKYQVNLVISDTKATVLKQAGVSIKSNKGTPGQFVTPTSTKQPTVIGTNGETLESIPLVGNGSEAIVTMRVYQSHGKTCLGLNKVELLKLVQFESTKVTHLLDDAE